MIETLECRELFSFTLTTDAPAPTAEPAPAVVAERDPSTGMATGRRMHKPFVMTQERDDATP